MGDDGFTGNGFVEDMNALVFATTSMPIEVAAFQQSLSVWKTYSSSMVVNAGGKVKATLASERGSLRIGETKTLIGNQSVKDVVGDSTVMFNGVPTQVKPGTQGIVDKRFVEPIAQDMAQGKFNWNEMIYRGEPDPIILAHHPDDYFVIVQGHHRFIAAQMTNTPIPLNNPNAVNILDDLPFPSGDWEDYRWGY